MRLLVTGAGVDGRSYLREVSEIHAAGPTELFEAAHWPPSALPASDAELYDKSPDPGVLQWKIVTFPAHHHIAPHFTASIDLDFVFSGSVILGLTDGEHHLSPGDCVVVRGVGHSWTTGPDGATMVITRIGTARNRH